MEEQLTLPTFSHPLTSVYCAACGRELTDDLSRTLAMGPECRAQYNYRHISALTDGQRIEVTSIIHAIAKELLLGNELRGAMFRLHELGFVAFAKRLEQRLWRATVEVSEPVALAVPAPKPPLVLPFKLTQGQDLGFEMSRRVAAADGYACGVIVGFAGVGKTTLIKVLGHEHGLPQIITPTGKAALRVREATGLDASTIHRWIYRPVVDPKTGVVKFARREGNDISIPSSRMVILDEASMVGPEIWKDLRQVCVQHDLKLIVIGDGFQLPPVQKDRDAPAFSVLTPAFAAELGAERVEMTEVLRQAQDSPVIRASMALRAGWGVNAFRELEKCDRSNFGQWALNCYKWGGVTICHRNATRYQLNAMFRSSLGIYDEMPQPGEPLLVLKNAYEIGMVNGESFTFDGWSQEPMQYTRVYDRYKNIEENTRFGGTRLGENSIATVSIEELHGRLTASPVPIAIAANRWARTENVLSNDRVASHVHANFGYVYTAHKAQGSQWPGVLVVIEQSVRLDEEEGRRWSYTAITRAQHKAAVCLEKLF